MERATAVHVWKLSKTKSKFTHPSNHVFYSRQMAPDDRRLTIYSVLLVLARVFNLSCSANAISAENRKFFPTSSHLVPSFGVTPFEFIEKLYGSETRVFLATDSENLVILACTIFDWSTRVTDRWTELR